MNRASVPLLIVAVLLAACGNAGTSVSPGGSPGGSDPADEEFRIGAFALVPFTQLQDMIAGFKESATACGMVEGENTTYFVDFAQGEESVLQQLANRDLENGVDLFVALDTPSMVTMAAATSDVPIVAVAPTFPETSGVVDSLDGSGTNVTGGSDYIDPAVTLDTLQEVLPDVQTLGIIYNPSEQNSASFQEAIVPAAEERGLEVLDVTVTNTAEIQTAARGLVGRVDAILLGPDNTAISAAPIIAEIASSNDIPLVSYVSGVAVKGALMDLGVSYTYLGQQAGEQACEILLEGADPATMPFTTITDPSLTINTDTADSIGVTIPEEILADAEKVTTEAAQ